MLRAHGRQRRPRAGARRRPPGLGDGRRGSLLRLRPRRWSPRCGGAFAAALDREGRLPHRQALPRARRREPQHRLRRAAHRALASAAAADRRGPVPALRSRRRARPPGDDLERDLHGLRRPARGVQPLARDAASCEAGSGFAASRSPTRSRPPRPRRSAARRGRRAGGAGRRRPAAVRGLDAAKRAAKAAAPMVGDGRSRERFLGSVSRVLGCARGCRARLERVVRRRQVLERLLEQPREAPRRRRRSGAGRRAETRRSARR